MSPPVITDLRRRHREPFPDAGDQADAVPGSIQLACVTHELRTPLTAIRGALELIASGVLGPLPDSATEMLTIARANSDRLLRLVDDIMRAESQEGGQVFLRCEPLDLDLLLHDAMAANAGLLAGRAGRFVLAGTFGRAIVSVDRDRMLQVMANLLSNAVKFAPEGSDIALSLRGTVGGYRMTVADRGPGIPETFRPHVFRRFARAPETAAIPGTGLGLHIARAIVLQHGGEIGFDCPPGGGTHFHVDLPAMDAGPGLPDLHPM
jgi:signal transduction histidine kinase